MLFDIYNNLEEYNYELTLCYKNKKPICILEECKDTIKYIAKFGDIDELSFVVPSRIQDLETHQFIDNPNYDLVKGHFLVLLEAPDFKKYFVIDTPKESEGDKENKEVQCYSLETDLKKKYIRNFKGTRQLYKIEGSAETGEGILNLFEEETTWTVGFVDPLVYQEIETVYYDEPKFITSLSVEGRSEEFIHNKYRTFDVAESSWWDFVKNEIEKAFDCIVLFDTENKIINVYHIDTLSEDKGLYISKDNYLKNINKEPKFGEIYTRLRVYGKDGISINSVNPLGTDYIEDFSYYMENGYMSAELVTALTNYNALLDLKKEEFQDLLGQKLLNEEILMTKQGELKELEFDLSLLITNRDGAAVKGEDQTTFIQQIRDKELEISNKKLQITNVDTEITSITNQIIALRDLIDKKNNFTTEELEELDEFTFETTWQNENYFVADELYEAGKKALDKLNKPTLSFSMDIANLFDILECSDERKKIKLGNIIHVETRLGVIEQRLVEYTHEVGSSLSIVCTNKDKKEDYERYLTDSITQAINAGNTVVNKKFKWDKSEENSDWINDIIENNFDAAKYAIIADKQRIKINEHGVELSSFDNPGIVKMINNIIALSADGENYTTAIRPEGIVSERLIGKIILGLNLIIGDPNGNLEIKGNLMTIRDNLMKLRVRLGEYEEGKFGLQLFSRNNDEVLLSEDGIAQVLPYTKEDNLDTDDALEFLIYIDDNVLSVRKAKLAFKLLQFRSYEKTLIGGSSSRSTTLSGGYYDASGVSQHWGNPTYVDTFSNVEYPVIALPTGDGIRVKFYDFRHTHPIEVPDHEHGMAHTHGTTIERGIFKGEWASGVKIYVDGVLRLDNGGSGYNSDQMNIDLTQWIQTPGFHTIKLSSATMGRIHASLYIKQFISM